MTIDIPSLTAASRSALANFDLAKASGSPSRVGAARAELLRLKGALELTKVDAVLTATMSAALHTPARMGR